MPKPKCDTCGGEDFFTDAGFFYCVECQTQSQDIREEVFDDFFTGQRGIIRTLKKPSLGPANPSVTGNKVDLTSWEIFNYVLKGLVDEVIKLGSKPKIKIVALQLWASYLKKLEVAFTSFNISRKPKLSLNFKPKDAEIVYGVSRERIHNKSLLRESAKRKRILSASSGSDSSVVSVLSKRASAKKAALAKKALVEAEYEQTFSTVENESLSQDISNLTLENFGTPSEHSDSVKSKRIKLTKHAKSYLQKARVKLTKIKQEKDKIVYRKKMLRKQLATMNNLTLSKVVALLNLALLFNKDNIHIGDILRWIAEGHLSVNKCEKFIPEHVKIPMETHRVLDPNAISHSGQQTMVMNLCAALDISELPTPNLCSLAERYCQELQLPDDFATTVQSWITHTPKQLIRMDTKFESRTMAYIIVLLKMIFSLDGVTENKLSELASEVNRSVIRQEEPTLFTWTDWVEYIECRKAIVSSFHYVTRQSVYKDLPGKDSRLFLDHYEQTTFKNSSDYLKTVMNEDWRDAVKKTLNQLNTDDSISTDIIRFPPTLTPMYTYCQILITEHQNSLSNKAKSILAQDFTKHSTSFLFNPKSSLGLGAHCDLDILLQAGIANTCVVEQFTETREIIENDTVNRKNVRVQIMTKENKNIKKEPINQEEIEVEIKKEGSDFSDIVSDDSSDEEEEEEDADIEESTIPDDVSGILPSLNETKCSLPLYETRQTYWICHKKFESNDDFNFFAADVFPSPFLWLLKECASVIGVTIRDLYEEVMFLEIKKNVFTKSTQYLRKRKKLSL